MPRFAIKISVAIRETADDQGVFFLISLLFFENEKPGKSFLRGPRRTAKLVRIFRGKLQVFLLKVSSAFF